VTPLWMHLDLRHTSVHAQLDAGDQAAVVGCQEQCGRGDLLGATQSVEWHCRGELCFVCLTIQNGGVDWAGAGNQPKYAVPAGDSGSTESTAARPDPSKMGSRGPIWKM
jgi:hypothetical protein